MVFSVLILHLQQKGSNHPANSGYKAGDNDAPIHIKPEPSAVPVSYHQQHNGYAKAQIAAPKTNPTLVLQPTKNPAQTV
jgi:hypothetical protein